MPGKETTDLIAELQRVRSEIKRVQGAITVVESAPVPRVEAHAHLSRYLDALASRLTFEEVGSCLSSEGLLQSSAILPEADRLPAFLAAIFGAELRQRLGEKIDRLYTADVEASAIPAAERPARLEKLRAERRELETREEEIVVAAEAAGHRVLRRPDADPAAVLGVSAQSLRPAARA